MKYKKILLMSLMAVFLISMVNATSGTLTLRPAAGGEVRGTYNFTISCGATCDNLTYGWIDAYSLDTVNSSYKQICEINATGLSNDSVKLSCEVNTETWFMDGRNYYFRGRAQNGTTLTNGTTDHPDHIGENFTADINTGIIVDNTAPVCTDNSGFIRGDTVAPNANWNFVGGNATSGTIHFGGNNYQLTEGAFTGRNLALSFSKRVPEQVYTVTTIITDGVNSTTCPIREYINLEDSEKAKRGVAVTTAAVAKKLDPLLIIIALIAVFALNNKKKKK